MIAISIGSLALVISELLPVGMISEISAGMGVSEGIAGLTVAMPAIVAAVAAFVLGATTGRVDRKHLLLAYGALFVVSNALSALAPDFAVLLIARGLLGVSIGGFWSQAGGLATRITHERSVGRATAFIFSGISIGSVVGVPTIQFLATVLDWRLVFWLATAFAAAAVVGQAVALPSIPAVGGASLATLPRLLRRGPVVLLVLGALTAWIGQYAAYTFITPYYAETLQTPQALMTTLLVLYGVGGIVGNFLGGALAARRIRVAVVGTLGALTLALAATQILTEAPAGPVVVTTVWGLVVGAGPVTMQNWAFRAAPDAREAVSAILASVLQAAIAIGSAVGGVVVDLGGTGAAMWFGAALALSATAIGLFARFPKKTTSAAVGSRAGSSI
ncbi:MFS transporter [Microbacterium indicum]|uniref:MFS transporter n=1 Tax=Microbacterium indicum TaxID=358100 RepID=UPI000689003D|nr:MFS transporter [Microbacterium indicum]